GGGHGMFAILGKHRNGQGVPQHTYSESDYSNDPNDRASAHTLLDCCTLGGILGAPVLSIVGFIGLIQPPTTVLYQIGTGLVVAAVVLLFLAIIITHIPVGDRRAR